MTRKSFTLRIEADQVEKAIEMALSAPYKARGNFFIEIRSALHKILRYSLQDCGLHTTDNQNAPSCGTHKNMIVVPGSIEPSFAALLPKDSKSGIGAVEFCRRFGYDDYSLTAINYRCGGLQHLPSLFPFLKLPVLSLGNFAVRLQNGDYEVAVEFGLGIGSVGWGSRIISKRGVSFVSLYGLWIETAQLHSSIHLHLSDCDHEFSDLDDIYIGNFPVVFICKRCGQLLTCSCFNGYLDIAYKEAYRHGYLHSEVQKISFKNMIYRDGICHLCRDTVPKMTYLSSDTFRQKYLPYIYLTSLQRFGKMYFDMEEDQPKNREAEDITRDLFGYPRIGERWVSETKLYHLLRTLLYPLTVVFHYRGSELEGLELDVWIPDLKLGVEYQGEQHYHPLDHWGGIEGLKMRQKNDLRKKLICRKLGYNLLEFSYKEEISMETVCAGLSKFLDLSPMDRFDPNQLIQRNLRTRTTNIKGRNAGH